MPDSPVKCWTSGQPSYRSQLKHLYAFVYIYFDMIASNKSIKLSNLKHDYLLKILQLFMLKKKYISTGNILRHNNNTIKVKKEISSKNILFFGTDNFSLASLKYLFEKKQEGKIEKLHVVTQFKKPYSPVALFCKEWNLSLSNWPLQDPPKGYDMGIVVSFGHLIPENIIRTFPLGIINVHGSLLPRWRGSSPIIHAILNGDKETGVTIMNIHPLKFDVGEIIYQEKIKIDENTKSLDLTNSMAELGARCLLHCLYNDYLLTRPKIQPKIGVTKAPKIKDEYCEILWELMDPKIISLMFHAFDDYFPLWTSWHGKKIFLRQLCNINYEDKSRFDNYTDDLTMYEYIKKLKKDRVKKEEETIEKEIASHKGSFKASGQVMYIKANKTIRIKCLNGFIDFKSIKIKGKKTMSASEFYNGFISKFHNFKHYFY